MEDERVSVLIVGRPSRRGDTKGMALFAAVLAGGEVILVVVGIVNSQPGLVVFGVPLAIFFGLGAWFTSPTQVSGGWSGRALDRYQVREDAFFRRLGIEWFTGPPPDAEGAGGAGGAGDGKSPPSAAGDDRVP